MARLTVLLSTPVKGLHCPINPSSTAMLYKYAHIERSGIACYSTVLKIRLKVNNDVMKGKNIEEASSQKIVAFTGNWWTATLAESAANIRAGRTGLYMPPSHSQEDVPIPFIEYIVQYLSFIKSNEFYFYCKTIYGKICEARQRVKCNGMGKFN